MLKGGSTGDGHNTTIVLDTGKNHAGVCRFKLTGKQAGDRVVMRYGELLAADGKTLNPMTSVAGQIKGRTENTCILNPGRSVETGLHVAYQADEMILSGRADDWTPSYSWHGFRYIELTVRTLSYNTDWMNHMRTYMHAHTLTYSILPSLCLLSLSPSLYFTLTFMYQLFAHVACNCDGDPIN